MLEKEFTKKIRNLCDLSYKTQSVGYQVAGLPDLVCFVDSICYFLELKVLPLSKTLEGKKEDISWKYINTTSRQLKSIHDIQRNMVRDIHRAFFIVLDQRTSMIHHVNFINKYKPFNNAAGLDITQEYILQSEGSILIAKSYRTYDDMSGLKNAFWKLLRDPKDRIT